MSNSLPDCKPVILAIDIGTSGCRAAIFLPDGTVAARATSSYHYLHGAQGRVEQDPERIFDEFCAVIRSCTGSCPLPVDYVVLGSVLHSLVLMDRHGAPLTGLSIWADTRAVEQCRRSEHIFRLHGWHRATGCPCAPVYPLYRLLWYKEHMPKLLCSTHKAVSLKSFLLFRLFGTYWEDHSVASGTAMFNLGSRNWDAELLGLVGIEEDMLADVVPVEHRLAYLDAARATGLGLSLETRWIIGGADGPMAHLGSAGSDRRTASLTIGTSGAARVLTDGSCLIGNDSVWRYVLNKEFDIAGLATNNGGNVIDWYVDSFYPQGVSWPELEARLSATDKWAGVFFSPYLFEERVLAAFPASAGFRGLKGRHTCDDLLRAVVEGVVFNVCFLLEQLTAEQGEVSSVSVSGSLAETDFVVRLLSETLEIPVLRGSGGNAALKGLVRLVTGSDPAGTGTAKISSRSESAAGIGRERYAEWKKVVAAMK